MFQRCLVNIVEELETQSHLIWLANLAAENRSVDSHHLQALVLLIISVLDPPRVFSPARSLRPSSNAPASQKWKIEFFNNYFEQLVSHLTETTMFQK